jgi:hypothetical protein
VVKTFGVWIVFLTIPASLGAQQQQYGDPTNFPGTYVTQRTSPPTPPRFVPIFDVTYFVAPGEFDAAQHALINLAAATWSEAGGAAVRLVEVFAPGADIDFSQQNLNNNTTDLASRVLTTAPGPGTYPDGTPWRTITNADITIDTIPQGGVNNYYIGVGPFLPGQFDYFAVLLREFGFGLGLGLAGPGDPNSAMDSDITANEQRSSLTTEDIAALQTIYGTPEPATWALFGVGLLVMGAVRKLRRS